MEWWNSGMVGYWNGGIGGKCKGLVGWMNDG